MARSIAFRINSLVIVSLSVIVFGCLLFLFLQTNSISKFVDEELTRDAKKQTSEFAKNVYNLAETANDLSKKMLSVSINVAKEVLKRSGSPSIQGTQRWSAINQFTNESKEIDVPNLVFGGTNIPKVVSFTSKAPFVDEITQLTGATATIFVKMNQNGDMLRIATTVKKKNGERAIGTYIPAINPDGTPNPVVSTILQDKEYFGRAFVVDQWYVTAYAPLKLNNGDIIGMIYVGIPQKVVEEGLRKAIYALKIGETGYVWVLGGSGKEKGHYIISKEGKRDGENIWNSKDAEGKYFVQEIVNGTTEKPGEILFFRYYWKNPEDPAPRAKIAAAIYYKDWDWVIGAGSYEDEIYYVRDKIRDRFSSLIYLMLVLAIVLYAVTIIISLQVPRRISKPIKQAANVAEAISRGDLLTATKLMNE
ncbi:MAG: Cache 3/Cache 2 fusion domain-containing protein [Candidatus Kapaibacteriota bacterium]